MSSILKRTLQTVGLGKFGDNSHPIHPSTVHFPIAFLTGANVVNLIYGVAIYVPALVPFEANTSNTGMLAIFGYFLNIIGLVTSVPALFTGLAELYAMIQGRGLYVKDETTGEQRLEPVVKSTLTHAAINDAALFGAVYNWLMERNRGFEDYRPHGHQVLLSAGGLALTFYAAYLGGGLVYEHGVGVQRMGRAKVEKEKAEKKQ